MQIGFVYADKIRKDDWLPAIFEILYANMSVIAPTGNSLDKDYEEWYSTLYTALEKDPRKIVLMYDEDRLIGYFQYYVNQSASLFMMEEIQIRGEYHGKGVFQAFYKWLLPLLPRDTQKVEAYALKQNVKSRGILTHLGLCLVDGDDDERTVHYRGDFVKLLDRFNVICPNVE